ncbi:MAG: hypothetical protein CMQ34_09800 [Gammaproteobacteria bacterium]|nr:hypothetical protein [Gammaproteobacteria bacterium]
MAIRENPSLPNRHTAYIAKSGGGKSQALKQNKAIPRTGARVLLWDPNRDHKKHSTLFPSNDVAGFNKAVVKAMKSGKGFRLGYIGENGDYDAFDNMFCRLVWECLDGQIPLYILIEELAGVQKSPGVAPPVLQTISNQSRKYGGIMHWTTQKPTEVSKTVISATENFWIGNPGKFSTKAMEDYLAKAAECPNGAADLKALKPLQFYRSDSEKSELVTLKYKNI